MDCLELLREPPDSEVTVPNVAFQEVLAGESFNPTSRPSASPRVCGCALCPDLPTAPGLDQDRLDAGELAVLSLAIKNPGAIVVLDDRAAREEAIRRNIPLLGTAGILLRAKQQGRITAVRPALDSVRQAGLYLTDRLYLTVLRLAESDSMTCALGRYSACITPIESSLGARRCFSGPHKRHASVWSAHLAVITVTVCPSLGWTSPSHHDLRAAGSEENVQRANASTKRFHQSKLIWSRE